MNRARALHSPEYSLLFWRRCVARLWLGRQTASVMSLRHAHHWAPPHEQIRPAPGRHDGWRGPEESRVIYRGRGDCIDIIDWLHFWLAETAAADPAPIVTQSAWSGTFVRMDGDNLTTISPMTANTVVMISNERVTAVQIDLPISVIFGAAFGRAGGVQTRNNMRKSRRSPSLLWPSASRCAAAYPRT